MYIANKEIKMPSLKVKKPKLSGKMKRNLVVICSVLLIGGAIYLNWAFFSGENPAKGESGTPASVEQGAVDGASGEEVASADGYFSTAQINRQRARDESLEVLNQIIGSEDTQEDMKTQAQAEVAQMAAEIEQESNIEQLVISKGFEDCVAVINNGSVSVVVRSDGLMENEVTQIQEIIYEQTGILPVNTKIIEKE